MESRVSISSFGELKLKETRRSDGRSHKNGVDYFSREKFDHVIVVNGVREIFGDANYRKVLVVWDVEDPSVISIAKENYGIEIRYMMEILYEIERAIHSRVIKGSRDDVLRTVELLLKEPNVRARKYLIEQHKRHEQIYAELRPKLVRIFGEQSLKEMEEWEETSKKKRIQ